MRGVSFKPGKNDYLAERRKILRGGEGGTRTEAKKNNVHFGTSVQAQFVEAKKKKRSAGIRGLWGSVKSAIKKQQRFIKGGEELLRGGKKGSYPVWSGGERG